MKTTPTNPTPPDGYALCASRTCPKRSDCLHARVAVDRLTQERVAIFINPHHPEYREGEECVHFRQSTPEHYARGFRRGLSELSATNYTACTRHLIAVTSKSRFYRMRSGETPLTPAEQEEILSILRAFGYRGGAEEAFDAYEKRYTWY